MSGNLHKYSMKSELFYHDKEFYSKIGNKNCRYKQKNKSNRNIFIRDIRQHNISWSTSSLQRSGWKTLTDMFSSSLSLLEV